MIDMKIRNHDHTLEFLKSIADRLAGRVDCKQVEYVVVIGTPMTYFSVIGKSLDADELLLSRVSNGRVFMTPQVDVYPDTHHRRSTDKCSILDYILITKFYDTCYDGIDEYGHAAFREGSLTPGVYKYKLSVDKKRRKWTRIQ